ncbi:uncharacterized peptidase C1-like protein F26E4.3 [Hyposmocoma kahamanoa]|uniref:uncharacterized peptidase C1-like protein F26E4.3 n=1 Tax=Hyposmocoma kahamanoa TaxID=1477025 RepID=UPI000E6D779D|nr:uncharacterized peptidase C1-like protein F26E4.3 [Hyposmocoma kahamanoa]
MVLKTLPLILALQVTLVTAYYADDLPPGPYCGKAPPYGGCCNGRLDRCSHHILDTLCYCDEFCSKNRQYDDCCPDYEPVCLGLTPGNITAPICRTGARKKNRCHECVCRDDSGIPDWYCDNDLCLMSDEVILGINRGGHGWRADNYTQYSDKKLKDGLIYQLGTLPLDKMTQRMNPVQYHKNIAYPDEFDARQRWPDFISPIVDQGWCGSDWAVAIASIASDRYAIQSNGAENVLLSPQSLLSCDRRGQLGCKGGHVDGAWHFTSKYGLVDLDCFPYTASVTNCPYSIQGSLLQAGCRPLVSTRISKYRTSVPYKIEKEHDVMWDIMESGPIMAIMTVYQDFFHYRDGIYRRSNFGDNTMSGLHSVKIIGWGVERGQKYWLVANSWGNNWGEDGYFRIARGNNECDIERSLISGFSDVNEARKK